MILNSYARSILDALFHTGGSVGKNAQEELDELLADGVIAEFSYENQYVQGVSGQKYKTAFMTDQAVGNDNETRALDDYKKNVNATNWWRAEDLPQELLDYRKKKDDGTYEDAKKYFNRWKITKLSEQANKYPGNTFLALFTQMPDESGSGYVEPGETTTYIRVNLHNAIITGTECLNEPRKDAETGKSIIDNKQIIMFPEICDSDWGNIIGFGIFDTEEVASGVPILWGRLSNENGIQASVDHVPLFRIGEFQVYLQ